MCEGLCKLKEEYGMEYTVTAKLSLDTSLHNI